MELRNKIDLNKRITVEEFSKLRDTFSNGSYFILSIGLNDSSDILKNGVKNISEYSQRINQIAFSIGTNTYLLNDKRDTIRSTIQDFQRSYGMSPRATILFAFPRNQLDNSDGIDFIYNDKYFGIEKTVLFKFQTKHILKNTPELSFNNND
jgi:hypothetical protein